MENEEEPQSIAESSDDEGSKEKEESKPATMRELAIRIGGLGNFAYQILVIALETGGLLRNKGSFGGLSTRKQVGRGMTYGSCGLGAVNSPVVVYKERQLTKEDTLRTALNGIREQQGILSQENNKLSADVDELESEVDRMKDVESALRDLSETQGSQLSELMDLIGENKEINEGLRAVLKSMCLEKVITLVLDMDNDGSFTIENKEIERLIIGMDTMEESITFDHDMFREEVKLCGGNVDEVIALIKKMIHGCRDQSTRCQIELDQDPEEFFKKQRSKGY